MGMKLINIITLFRIYNAPWTPLHRAWCVHVHFACRAKTPARHPSTGTKWAGVIPPHRHPLPQSSPSPLATFQPLSPPSPPPFSPSPLIPSPFLSSPRYVPSPKFFLFLCMVVMFACRTM